MDKVIIGDQNKFNFFVPAHLEKGTDKEGKEITWIDGIASTSRAVDSDKETLFPSGFDWTPLLESGFFNYNHKANVTSGAIVGQPTEAKLINNRQDFYVKGFIYPNEEGKKIVALAETLKKFSPDRKIGFSIEGTATSRDPFDSKKITGAIISGIAITVQPKNKNTLMNIIKGEYAEPFVKDEDEEQECVKCGHKNTAEDTCDCIKKDMTTDSIRATLPESVEHNPKDISNKNAKIFGSVLKKSDIYSLIINKYNNPSIAETKNIYSLIEKTQKNLFSMNTATPEVKLSAEAIQKSFDLLDQAIALVKSNDAAPVVAETAEVIVKSDEAAELEKAEIIKSKDTAAFLQKAGMDKETACDTMVKGGISLVVAQGAWESVLADANASKQGGNVTTETAPIVKSEEIQQVITKSLEPVQLGMKNIGDSIVKGFEGSTQLIKSLTESNATLVKSNEEFALRLEAIEKQSPGRRSLTGVKFNEKFEKGNEGAELTPGTEVINIKSKTDLAKLVTLIDAANDVIKAGGKPGDVLLEKAIESIEICNEVPKEAYARLRAMNIILQAPEA